MALPPTVETEVRRLIPALFETSSTQRLGGMEAVWKAYGSQDGVKFDLHRVGTLKKVTGPTAVRETLGLSQRQFGAVLGLYLGREPLSKHTVSMYEWHDRTHRKADKYSPSPTVQEAYRAIVDDVVKTATDSRLRVKSHIGKWVWRFTLRASCRACGTEFTLTHSRQVNCWRHRR